MRSYEPLNKRLWIVCCLPYIVDKTQPLEAATEADRPLI